MAGSSELWIGSAYLFLQSTSEKIVLPSLYGSSQQKSSIFKALKLAFADSTGSLDGVDMLKVHCSEPHLIIQLKFCVRENCRKFLRSYRAGLFRESLQNHLRVTLSVTAVSVEVELKTGSEQLDHMLNEEERCLDYIYKEKPDRLRDEEIAELEESFRSLTCQQKSNNTNEYNSLNSSSLHYCSGGSTLPAGATFIFQEQQFVNRTLTPDDHQKFAKLVSKKWKQVGRSLQKSCRALRDPVIDNLAHEYDREGLYEQAYQLLLRFIQSEGKRATLQRLIAALAENSLISIAEDLLGLHHSENNTS
ncbi:tumor necrosis factor receptor type 1-associated DEATH domain protein [Pelodiscus sinensis]|uniref:Tumor necrosis factor receptor type 1-associated DEATH domain protein n=1 Tax=Pelodiscus sinensis TaxID=13735 RepID=K7F8S3_PELSI|nr:tumor necrosis factor receptor type 1-associated DEATH domain protein [Pelodiscus sinensis]|eukprot:XP_006121021.1 tumor necrosis factor receptor type 1-associated DEATH domain protein [Pelodiscus sinensis]